MQLRHARVHEPWKLTRKGLVHINWVTSKIDFQSLVFNLSMNRVQRVETCLGKINYSRSSNLMDRFCLLGSYISKDTVYINKVSSKIDLHSSLLNFCMSPMNVKRFWKING